jgi:hypothetical protein
VASCLYRETVIFCLIVVPCMVECGCGLACPLFLLLSGSHVVDGAAVESPPCSKYSPGHDAVMKSHGGLRPLQGILFAHLFLYWRSN